MTDERCVEKTISKKERVEGSRLQLWHLVLSVIGVVVMLGLQSGTAVWWAATLSSQVENERTLRILAIENEKSARASEKRAQNKIDDRQDADIRRSEDQTLARLKAIDEKLDWLTKNRR